MILKLPDDLVNTFPSDYYQSTDLYLWIISVIIGFIASIIFYKQYGTIDSEMELLKKHYFSMFFVIFFMTLTRIFYILGTVHENVDYDNAIQLGYLMSMIGFTLFLFVIEKVVFKNSHNILTIIIGIGVVVSILGIFDIISQDLTRLSNAAISMLGFFIVLGIHLMMAVKNVGEVRKKALICTLGIILLIMGFVGDSVMVYEMIPDFPLILPPIIYIVGIIIMVYAKSIKED